MKQHLPEGEGFGRQSAISNRLSASNAKPNPKYHKPNKRLNTLTTCGNHWVSIGHASAFVEDSVDTASRNPRSPSKRNGLHCEQPRTVFEAESKPTRTRVERVSKDSRSALEQPSKTTRRVVEQSTGKNKLMADHASGRTSSRQLITNKNHVCSHLRRPLATPGRGLAFGVLIYVLFATCKPSFAQQVPPPIEIGEFAPDFHTEQVLNHPTGALKFSDYAGKLLILDFWATWCQPCIAMIPEMERLQREFDGQLQFISITSQSKDEIQRFLDRMEKKRGAKPDIPYVVEDNEVKNAFPHGTIPHYVWLDGTGKVLAITGSEEVTEANIRQMLAEPIALKRKTEVIRNYDRHQPLLFDMETIEGTNLLFNRALVGYIPGIGVGMVQTINSSNTSKYVQPYVNYRRITVRNESVAALYQVAFADGKRNFGWENTVLEVEDPGKLYSAERGNAYDEWLAAGHGFCYELILPKEQAHEAWDLMKADLRKWFPQYTAKVEKRATPSICLVRIGDDDLLKSKGGEFTVDMGPFGGEIKNAHIGYLISELYVKGLKVYRKPIINLTDYQEPIDVEIDADLSSIESINEALERYGLMLVEQEHEVETLVIRDSK